MNKVLFIFRRDLRIEDNIGLLFALKNAKQIIACFIFTPEQIENNPYRSDHCLQFMIESLEDLSTEIKSKGGNLYLFYGEPAKVVAEVIEKLAIDGVVVNADYTPYSTQRDHEIELVCKKNQVFFRSFDDALLHSPQETLKTDGTPYTVFTPFFRNAFKKLTVQTPTHNSYTNYYSEVISFAKNHTLYKTILPTRAAQAKGGRQQALKILNNLDVFSHYSSTRDFPAKDSTTHLSAHLKFNTCSAREAYYAIEKKLGAGSALIRSLYWRDFFTGIVFHFPHVFKGPFKHKFDHLAWSDDKKLFESWCQGNTGFPIIDAGMREMNATGFMHNRVRMITASFLVKDLHINWQWGEKYFAQKLIDYDPAVNNGNWQWAAGTGCDAQPYFRTFNPWTQGLKFDADCAYIKQWIPELRLVENKMIHKWEKYASLFPKTTYPAPLVNHSKESKRSLIFYKSSLSKAQM